MTRFGHDHIERCIYGILGGEITKYTVRCGDIQRF
jgi:hypothetical protein